MNDDILKSIYSKDKRTKYNFVAKATVKNTTIIYIYITIEVLK